MRPELLAPTPRRCVVGAASTPLPGTILVRLPDGLERAPAVAELLAELGAPLDRTPTTDARPTASRNAPFLFHAREEPAAGLPAQGYRLRVSGSGIDLLAADRAGLLNGVATLRQWLRLHDHPPNTPRATIRPVEIEDWPDFRDRGVMLDVSRNKVPSLATLERLIDRLASLKINQLQLYTEHTFAYAGHEEVWRSSSPLTPSDVRALDVYCADRGVELVPNQNSLGHFHRWLVHDPYRRLAECPEGIEHPWSGGRREPFSLCPIDPDSLRLLEDLYDQLLPCFRSSLFNVGLDETFDLGLGRSSQACATRGRDRVYLDFLRAVHARVSGWGRRMMFWGDIVLEQPQLLSEVPSDAVALLWGYEADHPFAEQCRSLSASGLEFYVCPGTSSWLSLAGRWPNALHNLASAARAGIENEARGYLVTDWGDRGHLQPLPISYPGFLAGACFAWNASSAIAPETLPLAELLDRWMMPELPAGDVLLDLATAHLATGRQPRNSTVPFHLLVSAGDPLTRRSLDRLDPDAVAAASAIAVRCAERLQLLQPTSTGAEEGEQLRSELGWAARAVSLGCDLGEARLRHGAIETMVELPAAARAVLRARFDVLTADLEEIWNGRNRAGGLSDSLGYLRSVRDLLRP